ncbi:MAG TPA: polysaccharide biosynthesis C-terminal domain-containing protein [Bacteroidales bacterium]|jgi:O-antigen/teichoic acid export membrane protein|nr:oligosaccharide flippase family protein [Bacteroidales bacterium]HNR42668.1 polysaccharide biosynthesis C-terminal domain-containing protein [Bacteroidales bacterium]HPM17854.1 polysaccharide biosynthesis C-terminal domain-containing protein [Bacteroidales bacterium]HQH24748.1 polysaccharide biosynthesis C-terminal domain-containing protein [Bacteroidales bacterium]
MQKLIKTSFRDSFIYGLGNISVKVIGFLLIPLYTDPRYFSVDEFGIIALLDISGIVLISLMASGLPQSLMRWYWDDEFRDNQKGIFFMSLSNQVIVSISFCIILIPLAGRFSTLIFGSEGWSNALKILILSTALQAINNIINSLMRIQSKALLFSVANFIKLAVVLILTVYLIVFRQAGVKGIYIAQVAGNLLFIILLSVYVARNCRIFFNLQVFKSMSRYGFPLLISNFAAASLAVIDRYSLNSLALLKYVAIYTMAYKISSVLKLVIVDSIKMAITPMVMQKMNSPDNKRFYSKTLLYSSFVLMLGIITLSLFSYEIIKIISRSAEFWIAFIAVPVLSLSVFFANMRETSSYGLIINKKTNIVGISVIASSVLNIILNIILIPVWNITGAAIATITTQFFYWFLNYYYSQKEYHIPYELKKIAIMFICGGILSFAGLMLNELHIVPRLLIKTACVISFPFILYLFNFYEPVELQAIRGFISKWSRLRNLRDNLRSLKNIQ